MSELKRTVLLTLIALAYSVICFGLAAYALNFSEKLVMSRRENKIQAETISPLDDLKFPEKYTGVIDLLEWDIPEEMIRCRDEELRRGRGEE